VSVFKKPGTELASQDARQILKLQREDWVLFRTVEGLQQRAGVPKAWLRRLVLKELADNGLDNNAHVRVGKNGAGGYYVEDDGSGIDPDDVAGLCSIARPMVSTKFLRLPTRGALGNGLRVVAGAVLASQGSLVVITRNRRITLRPERHGSTTVLSMEPVDFPVGTRVEISFGEELPDDPDPFRWARAAINFAGVSYEGRTSPWWYDQAHFHELLSASGSRPVRDLVASLDGCSGAKAGEIVARAGLSRTICESVTRAQSDKLLAVARNNARIVKPDRLTGVGTAVDHEYSCQRGAYQGHGANIPYLVEAWAQPSARNHIFVCVNRTPVTAQVSIARDKRDIDMFGCGISHAIAQAPKDRHFVIVLNVITPYMPITSDGKAPNLRIFLDPIVRAVGSAVRKAHRPGASGSKTQKDVVLDNLDRAIAKVSNNGQYRFNQRQLLYALRPIVKDELDKELTTENFAQIITDYEAEHGEIPGMYREPRGSIYHPHRRETITLGTLMVETYERPLWTFNKLLYIEKEGFSEMFKDEQWGERHDCAIVSSKGFSTRAARDLIDKLAEHDEPITVFCVHDADAFGTTIYQSLQEATRARGARKIEIINLGLEPEEALGMGLEVEDVKETERWKPVADYAAEWGDWLQTHRVELNAMTTPQFIEWLDGKMADYDKLMPSPVALEEELSATIEKRVRAEVTERILREAGFEAQVSVAIAAASKPTAAELEAGIRTMFEEEPECEWRDYIRRIAGQS